MTTQEQVDAWNNDGNNPVGCAVYVLRDNGEILETVTRSVAEVLSGHTAVIWVRGITGCYALERVTRRA